MVLAGACRHQSPGRNGRNRAPSGVCPFKAPSKPLQSPFKAPSKRLHLSQQGSLLFGAVVAGPQGGARRGRQRGSVNEFNEIEHAPLTALLHDPQPIAKRTAAQSTAVAAGAR